jgi:Ca-activated chloride channel family protein
LKGWRFSLGHSDESGQSPFDQLYSFFQELILHASGDVDEALSWLTQIDREFEVTGTDYSVSEFIDELMERGLIKEASKVRNPSRSLSAKFLISLRKKALKDLFGKIRRSRKGNHSTILDGKGDEYTSNIRPYIFGDKLENLELTQSIKNAQINHGIDEFKIAYEDLRTQETFYQSQMSTVLMIDISHSMILYGEDRITPAKKIALALGEYITRYFPKDTLDVIVFGDDAWQIQLEDILFLEVGPYHTNTVAGLELAINLLQKRRNPNKQIMMITDGKPTCIKKGKKYYKNSWGLDRSIINRTINLAVKCRKLGIPVTTFMIADDPYLMQFVDEFTSANNGKAFYSNVDGLGDFIFSDYRKNKHKKL